jgi:UDPglucose 6-dehydrogenase
MKIVAVIGIWHLGIINCVGFAEKGYEVIGIDFEKSESLKRGIAPIYEPDLDELIKKHISTGCLNFTNDITMVSKADYIVIAHDSPINEKDEVDIAPIINSAILSAKYIRDYTPIIITSQVPLASCENIQHEVRKINPNWQSGVIYTPENLKLGSAIQRFLKPDMLVFGADNALIHEQALSLYESFDTEKITMDLRSAEMVKHALNTFLATEITFINEIANLSDRLGANAVLVGKALKLDSRIGKHALMTPGLGFSGGTLARDVTQLRKFSKELNYDAKLLNSIVDINEGTYSEILTKLKNKIGDLKDKSIGILGLTYKPGTSTMRRSPAIKIIEKLHIYGAKCIGYDPKANDSEMKEYENLFVRTNNIIDLFKDRDAIVLVTEWQEFNQLDFVNLCKIMKTPIFIDSKNYLSSNICIGFDYQGFGRK